MWSVSESGKMLRFFWRNVFASCMMARLSSSGWLLMIAYWLELLTASIDNQHRRCASLFLTRMMQTRDQ
ncbi:hypothetical protein WK60_35060 [Burkholderia ubonensis]|nr:hypothetical protein WK60_35060 [Burkholderia ubonensis]